jgi:hypothetical protein
MRLTSFALETPALAPAALVAQTATLDARAALGLTAPQPVVMILGTHHMANDNLDAVKTAFDDPRSPKRQAELRVVLDRIAEFRPTKIAIEAPWGSTRMQERYRDYLAGRHELSANEIDQVAFRLAKELGHATVHPIDYREGLDFDGPMKFAAEHGQGDKVQAMQRAFGEIARFLDRAGQGTLLDMYRVNNDRRLMDENQKLYVYLAEIGKDTAYVGAEQLVRWYDRNAKIAMNIVRTASSPDDRVLVLIGSGHAYLLNEILSHSPRVKLEWAEDYLR